MKTSDLNEIMQPILKWPIIYGPRTIVYDCLDKDVMDTTKLIYFPIMGVLKVCIHASK